MIFWLDLIFLGQNFFPQDLYTYCFIVLADSHQDGVTGIIFTLTFGTTAKSDKIYETTGFSEGLIPEIWKINEVISITAPAYCL